MKWIYFIPLLILWSCSEEDFEIPTAQTQPIPRGTILSLNAITSGLDRNEVEKRIQFSEEDQFTEGYVISSDESGNFFREIIIQDFPENPTIGILIKLDERALYEKFPLGSKLRIRLKGLSLGFENGVIQLGVLKENQIAPIDFSSIENQVFRTQEIATLQPLTLEANQITRNQELLYVTLNNLQFDTNLITPVPITLAAESTDHFDAFRPALHCPSGVEISLCTSTFSSFKQATIPVTMGGITGVLSRDFGDDFFVIKMNSIADLDFPQSNARCESNFFECATTNVEVADLLFSEDFETITNENKLEPLGWFNINVTGDEKRWEDRKVTNINNRTLSISAFNTNLRPLEAWLITPEINLEGIADAYFKCKIRTRFNNGKTLNLWITNAYTGDPLTTVWELLPAEIPIASSNFKTIIQSISCKSGKIRIAFQYKGFDPIATSTYELDDVQFFGSKL